jgi:H+/Cl- antiporter ClcA
VAAGLSSAAFLVALRFAQDVRTEHPWLLMLLPVVGAVVGAVLGQFSGRAAGGNRRVMTEIAVPGAGVPFRMTPIAGFGSVLTHLFGGSAGREGAAIQLAAGISDTAARAAGFDQSDRRVVLTAAVAGGFGAIFGVPIAGVVFALEVVPSSRRERLVALPAAVVASTLGHLVVGWVGVHHEHFGGMPLPFSVRSVVAIVMTGAALGLVARAFIFLTDGVSALRRRVPGSAWWNGAVALATSGAVVVALVLISNGRRATGLSTGMIADALGGRGDAGGLVLKLVLTAVTVGAGWQGGEVTPTFVMGAVTGATIGGWLGAGSGALARVGMVACFGAVANAPVCAVVLGVELFGWRTLPGLVVVAPLARWLSGPRHVYEVL